MISWIKGLFVWGVETDNAPFFKQMETDIHGLPYIKNIVPMPKVKPTKKSGYTTLENCRAYNSGTTVEGLKLALSHCTKYEDRMFLQVLINVHLRNMEK